MKPLISSSLRAGSVLAFSLLLFASLCVAQAKQTFIGTITDSMCPEADHSQMQMGPTDAACTLACVDIHGATYVLYDPNAKKTYMLSDQKTPAKFAGQKVKVVGTLDAKGETIKVDSITDKNLDSLAAAYIAVVAIFFIYAYSMARRVARIQLEIARLKKYLVPLLLIALLFVPCAYLHAQASRPLDIYFIDVEGGASTLLVSPSGESFLIDTGWMAADRDPTRIYAAAQLAGVKKIDHLLISHWHADHVGGLAALSKMIPIGNFYDHGNGIEPENQQWLDSYTTAAGGHRTILKPGDEIPVKGLRVQVVSADQKILQKPINGGGAPNPLCATAEQKAELSPENQRTVGVLVSYGKFKYLNLIDLDWEKEGELACPANKLGTVTLYQTGRHGAFDGAGNPVFLNAIRPQVVVVNNGPRKGMGQVDANAKIVTPAGTHVAPYEKVAYLRLAAIPGIEGIWQEHLSLLDSNPRHNTSPEMIANLEDTAECKGNYIKVSVKSDGKFAVTNSRNGFTETYTSR